jgi:peptidoglycan/LPS O-acetylase OafA/YrhL
MGLFRLLLAIAVVLEHTANSPWKLMRGFEAVHVFFIISGFYMAMVLTKKYTGPSGLKKFYLNRFLRLYPVYIITTLLAISWYFFCQLSTHGTASKALIFTISKYASSMENILFWLPNFTLIGTDIANWFNFSKSGIISIAGAAELPVDEKSLFWLGGTRWVPQAWTIGSELFFYILAPFIITGQKYIKICAVILISFYLLFSFSGNFLYGGYFIWVFWIWLFAIGMLTFLLFERFHIFFTSIIEFSNKNKIPLFCILLSLFILPYAFHYHTPKTLLLIFSVISIPLFFELTKSNTIDRFIGELSYPVYCTHMLVAELNQTIIGYFKLSYSYLPGANVLVTILLSLALVFFVEKQIDKIRAKISL